MGTGAGILVTAVTSTGLVLGRGVPAERGRPAEEIGEQAASELLGDLHTGACVDEWYVILLALLQKVSPVLPCLEVRHLPSCRSENSAHTPISACQCLHSRWLARMLPNLHFPWSALFLRKTRKLPLSPLSQEHCNLPVFARNIPLEIVLG